MHSREVVERCIGRNIARLRRLRGMRQKALATEIGCTLQTISKYECGAISISGYRLYQLADALGVTVDAFFVGVKRTESQPRVCELDQAA